MLTTNKFRTAYFPKFEFPNQNWYAGKYQGVLLNSQIDF